MTGTDQRQKELIDRIRKNSKTMTDNLKPLLRSFDDTQELISTIKGGLSKEERDQVEEVSGLVEKLKTGDVTSSFVLEKLKKIKDEY